MKKEELKIGDRILLTELPDDLSQETSIILQEIIEGRSLVQISDIDEYGQPWFSVDISTGKEEDNVHTFAVMDDHTWEYFGEKKSFDDPEKQKISDQIEETLAKYSKEYECLAKKSEDLYDAQRALEQEYKKLDEKTGLGKLFEEFGKAIEK